VEDFGKIQDLIDTVSNTVILNKRMGKKKGKIFGRPSIEKPKDWDKIVTLWKKGEITAVLARKQLNMSRSTFYRRVNEMENS
jgi:DNA invertase Pin-like site-specific DNA recombinase